MLVFGYRRRKRKRRRKTKAKKKKSEEKMFINMYKRYVICTVSHFTFHIELQFNVEQLLIYVFGVYIEM